MVAPMPSTDHSVVATSGEGEWGEDEEGKGAQEEGDGRRPGCGW